MALENDVTNRLSSILNGGFRGTEGYDWIRNQALQATGRQFSNQRGSGNVLAALQDRAAGLAAQDRGNEFTRLAGLLGQEQANTLGNLRARNDFTLGTQSNDNTRRANDQQFGLGMFNGQNNFTLGQQRNMNDWYTGWAGAQTNWRNAGTNQQNAQTAQNNSMLNWWNQMGNWA